MSQAKFLINAELKPASLAACTLHGQQFAQSISSLTGLIPKDAILHLLIHKHDGLIGVEEMKNALSNHAISWMMMDDERSTWWQQGTRNHRGQSWYIAFMCNYITKAVSIFGQTLSTEHVVPALFP